VRQKAGAYGPRLGGQSVFVVIMLAAMIGGLLTVLLVYPMGLAVALLAAPVGASVSAVLLVSYFALRRSNVRPRRSHETGSHTVNRSQRDASTDTEQV
jgi:membrane protein implicated in regulation of membrane protease activity